MLDKMKLLCCLFLLVSYSTSQRIDLKRFKTDGKVESAKLVKELKDFTNRKDVLVLELNADDDHKSFKPVKNQDELNSLLDYEDVDSHDMDLPELYGLRALSEDGNRSHYGFSADYIDMAELARAEAELMEKGKQLIELKKKLKKAPAYSKLKKYLLSQLLDEANKDQDTSETDENGENKMPSVGRRSHKQSSSSEYESADNSASTKAKKKKEEDEDEDEEESNESVKPKKLKKSKPASKKKKAKVKVASVASVASEASVESEESTDDEVTTRRPRPKRKKKSKDDERIYDIIQSPFRKIKARRSYRMPHFLPKRYKWTSKEMKDLGYFWFNGVQGQDPP